MKYRAILLFGAPGAGKGTQGKILGQIPNFVHFSCGDAFRNLRVDSPLGRVFVEYASNGRLVPDEPTIQLWKQSMDGLAATGRFNNLSFNGIILFILLLKGSSDLSEVISAQK
jgi:adenylate kinase